MTMASDSMITWLVGRMHRLARDVLVQADFMRIVDLVDDAADRLGLLDLLAFHAKELRQPAALACADEVEAGFRPLTVKLRLNHKVLQDALGGDAGRIGFDDRLGVRRLARIVGRLLQLVQRNENFRAARAGGSGLRARFIDRHGSDPSPLNAEGMPLGMPSGGA